MDKPGLKGALRRFWHSSYAADYIGYTLLLATYITLVVPLEPFHRLFSLSDLTISYPHALHERVTALQSVIYAGALPLIFFILYSLILRPGIHKSHVTILGLLISLTLTIFLTDLIKNSVGRPRPDLLARCKPALGTDATTLVDVSVCTETDHHILHDGWRSFPSGHSSFSFAGLGYTSLWLCGQLHVFRPHTGLGPVLVGFAPLLGALMVALSRLADYRHDVYDVTAGSVLGLGVAWMTYRRYFRRLGDRRCDVPYQTPQGPVKNVKKDLEAQRQGAEEFELADLSEDEEEGDESQPLTAGGTSTKRRAEV